MSLQVWLPLNGDTKNYGLNGNIDITNNGAVINDNGKIGKCYYFNSKTMILPSYDTTKSICFWLKAPKTNSTIAFVDYKSKLGFGFQSNGYIIPNGSGMSLKMYDSSNYISNQWNHIAVVKNSDNTDVLLYINGILQTTRINSNNNWTNDVDGCYFGGRSTGTYMNCYINDIRIYDHALSTKEVQEIAKGLVLHYKLDGNGKGNDNILINSHFDARYDQSTGWDTSKNGTLLANSWGGYNSGVANASTVYHAHLKNINNEYVYEYIKTSNETWLGISQGGLQTKLIAGQTYTFSWEEYHVEGTNRVGTGLYYYKTGASSARFHLGISEGTSVTRVLGRWQKYSYTFVAPSDADTSKNISWYIYGDYNGNGTFYMRHPKLEIGNSATEWTPAITDSIYSILGYSNNTIYDSSGYQNHGIPYGAFSMVSNTPRYNAAIHLDGNINYIRVPFNEICPDNIFTINLWFKKDALGSKNYETLFGGPSGFEMDTRAGSSSTLTLYMASTRGGNVFSSFSFGQWYMVTMVRDGTNELYYVNGDLKKTIAAKPMPTGIYRIGAWNSDTGQNYYGEISDFRIYNNVLSADDIKELYNTSASVDNKGNIYAREVIEI